MVRTKSTDASPGAVAHAVTTKSKKNPLPSLLRKTKGSGIGASRLIPFSQRTHGTVATALPGQTFPNAKVDAATKPPISSFTVNQGSVQVSDLTDPPLHISEREPPPLDEIRTTVTAKSTNGSNVSETSSLSHSTAVKPGKSTLEESVYSPKSLQKYADQATKVAETTVKQVLNATEMVVHDGLKLLQGTILEPSCPGVHLPQSTKGDAKLSLSIGSGIVLQAPSPVTLNRVILQTQEELPPMRKSEISPVSDAAVNLEVISLETKAELQRQLSPQTDATVAGDAVLSKVGAMVDSRSEVASDARKPKNMDGDEASSKATGKKSAFRKVKALFGMGSNSTGQDKKQKVKPDIVIAAGIPVVVGKDVSVGSPKQADTTVSRELAPTISASFSDQEDHGQLSMENLTILTAPDEEAKKASPPSGHRMPSPMGVLANADAIIGLEPSPSSVAAVTRSRLPVDKADDDASTKSKELESPQSPDAMIFETPTSPMENMRPGNSPELAIKKFWGLSSPKRATDTEKVAFLLPAMGIQRLRKTGLEPDDEKVHVRVAVDAPEEEDENGAVAQDEKDDGSEYVVDDSPDFVDVDDGKIYDDENNVVGDESFHTITEKPSDLDKKMTLADILLTSIADGFGVEPNKPDAKTQNFSEALKISNAMSLLGNISPESPSPIRTGYNPFAQRNAESNGNSVYSNSGNANSAPKMSSFKTNPFDSSEAGGSGENDGIVVIQSTFSSDDDVDVFEKVALMNQTTKPIYINPFDDSSDEEGIPPAPVSSSFKESAAKLSTALLKGAAKNQTKNRKSQGPLSDRLNSIGNNRHSFGDARKEIQKRDGQTKSKSETSIEELYPAEPPIHENTMLEQFPRTTPRDSNAVLPTEIEMDEAGTVSDLDQSLRHFPMRIVEATEGTIVVSALDLNVDDAEETITTRESFDEIIDRYAVSPSLELLRQKTRTVGFVAPDGRNSPALADSISDIDTTIVNTERNDAAVSTSVGLLGLCNPFLLGSMVKTSEYSANEKENDSLEKEILTLAKAVDENSYEILNQGDTQVDMKDEENAQRSAESEIGPLHQNASLPTEMMYSQSFYPTPRISNEANHATYFPNHHRMADSISEAQNHGAEPLSTSKSSSHRKKKSLKEPLVYRVAASKSRSFFDDESDIEKEVQPIEEAIEEDPDVFPGERFSESLPLLNVEAPDICEAESDDFDASTDRYRSVEETPLNPTLNKAVDDKPFNPPIKITTVIDEDENHLLNRIISFGKETLGMSSRTKDTIRSRWECMTPKSKELVERCLKYAEIENAISTVGTDGGGTIEKVQSSGSGFTGPMTTVKDTNNEAAQTMDPSGSLVAYTLSFEKEHSSSKSEEKMSTIGTNILSRTIEETESQSMRTDLLRTIEGTASQSMRTDLLRTIEGTESQSMRTDEFSFQTAQSISNHAEEKMNSNGSAHVLRSVDGLRSQSKRTDTLSLEQVETSNTVDEKMNSPASRSKNPMEQGSFIDNHFTETIRSSSETILQDLVRPTSTDENESELLLNLGGSTVQRLIVTNSIDGTLRSLEAVWNEPTFTEDDDDSFATGDDELDRGTAMEPPELLHDEAYDELPTQPSSEKLLISLSAELSEYLKAFSEDDSRRLSTQEAGTQQDKTFFASICESFSQPVTLQSLELARDKLNEKLKRDISMISAVSRNNIEALLDETEKIAANESEVHDLIDLTGVLSQEEPAEGDAVWLFDFDGGNDNFPAAIFKDLDHICSSPFASFRSSTAKHRRRSVHANDIAAHKPNTIVDLEDMFFAMCENGEEMVCNPEPPSEKSSFMNTNIISNEDISVKTVAMKPVDVVDIEDDLNKNFHRGEGMTDQRRHKSVDANDITHNPNETIALKMVDAMKPTDVVAVEADLHKNSERGEGVIPGQSIDKTLIRSQQGSFCEYPNMMDQFRSESEALQSYGTTKSMEGYILLRNGPANGVEAEDSPSFSRASRPELQTVVGSIQNEYVAIDDSVNAIGSRKKSGKDGGVAASNRTLNHYDVEDILYSFCGGLENSVYGFEGYEVVPVEKKEIDEAPTSERQDGTVSNITLSPIQHSAEKSVNSIVTKMHDGPVEATVPSATGVARKSSESSVSSSDDFPTLLAKMQRDLRDPTVKEVKNPPVPENHLQSSNDRDIKDIRQKQLTPSSDIVNQRRDFLEILFDTTESLLCGGGKFVSVESTKKVRSKERRKSRKKTSKSGKVLKVDESVKSRSFVYTEQSLSESANDFVSGVEDSSIANVTSENVHLSRSNKIIQEKREENVLTCTADGLEALCHNAENFLGLDSTKPQLLQFSDEVLEKVVIDNATKALEKEDSFDVDTSKADLLDGILQFDGTSPVRVSTPVLEGRIFESDSVVAEATDADISQTENELVTDRISSQEYVVSDNHMRKATSLDEIFDNLEGSVEVNSDFDDYDMKFANGSCENSTGKSEGSCFEKEKELASPKNSNDVTLYVQKCFIARRPSPLPEVFNLSNRTSRTDKEIALSGLALKPTGVRLRGAPKPEFYAFDKSNCIAGYVSVPTATVVDSPYSESHNTGFDELKRNESELRTTDLDDKLLLVTQKTYSSVDFCDPPTGNMSQISTNDTGAVDVVECSRMSVVVETEDDVCMSNIVSLIDVHSTIFDESTMMPTKATQNDLHIDDSAGSISIIYSPNDFDTAYVNESFHVSTNEDFDDDIQQDHDVGYLSNIFTTHHVDAMRSRGNEDADVSSIAVEPTGFDKILDLEATSVNRSIIAGDAQMMDDVVIRSRENEDAEVSSVAVEPTGFDKILDSKSTSVNRSHITSDAQETDDVVIRFDKASDSIHGTFGLILSVSKDDKLFEANELASSVVEEIFEKEVLPLRSARDLCLQDVFDMAESIISGGVKTPKFDTSNLASVFTVPFEKVLEASASILSHARDDVGRRPETPIILYDMGDLHENETTFLFVSGEVIGVPAEDDNGLNNKVDHTIPTLPSDTMVLPVVNSIDVQKNDQSISSAQNYSLTGTPVVIGRDLFVENVEDQNDVPPSAIYITERHNISNVDGHSQDNPLEPSPASPHSNDRNEFPSSIPQENAIVNGAQLSTEACEDNVPSSPRFVESEVAPPQSILSHSENLCDEVPSASAQSNHFSKVAQPSHHDFQSGYEEQESNVEGRIANRKPSSGPSSDNQEYVPLEIVVLKSRKIVRNFEESADIGSLFETSVNHSGFRDVKGEGVEMLQPCPIVGPNAGEGAPFTKTLNGRDDQNVSSLLKRLGITKDTVASSIGPMAQTIDFLEDDLSQDDEESLSLLLALTRSETDITSVTGSYLPESPSAEILKVSVRDSSLVNESFAKPQTKSSSSFRSRMKRSKELLKKPKLVLDNQNKFGTVLESSANSSSGNSEILRSPLLTSLLRRLYKNGDASSNNVSSMESHGVSREALSLRKSMLDSTDAIPSSESNIRDIPFAIEITTSSNETTQNAVQAQFPDESRSFDVCENVLSNDSLLNSSGKESPNFIELSSVMDRLHIQNRSSDSSSGFGRQIQATQAHTAVSNSKEESGSESLNLPALLEELEIHTSKSGSFSVVSTDVEPLDVEDLFHRYDKIVKHMVVLDDERLARAQAIPIPQEKNSSSDTGTMSEAESHGNRQRSRFVGSMGLNQSSSDMTTPSQKARDLRLQLERALQSSAASRTSNAKLGKDLTTFQSLIQERRAISLSGRPRFTTQSAPSSPQVSRTSSGRSFYHRNCVSPSCIDRNVMECYGANLKPNSSSLTNVSTKSPIARIRELAGKRQNWDLRSSKIQMNGSAPSAKLETVRPPTIVVDELSSVVSIVDLQINDTAPSAKLEPVRPPTIFVDELFSVVSIVDLVSKSSEDFGGNTEPIDLTEPYTDLVDLVTKSGTFDDGSETALDYSDDGTPDSLQQYRSQRISPGF
jgi:hypothetical protein